MDFGNKLEDLKMTSEEIERVSKALKEQKFRELLQEYVQEISNPDNKKRYEEEITKLEQERGLEVRFIHPNPHHVLKTRVNGKEKCFINICSNNLINMPTCEARKDENGQVGQCWSLPYSLTPGRPDRDTRGNVCIIYDVVFHPDTLYMADRNTRFMKLVNSTATQGVEDAFKVTLDKGNTLLKKIQYKGVPQPAVIRTPIPGHPSKEESSPCDEDFPTLYPDTLPIKNPTPTSSSRTQSPIEEHTLMPMQPHYTIKYRSLVDLQDYRCSRDSAPSPRPKEIVITIDLPLLKSVAGVDLHVTDRKLALESQKPNYKLDLQLSYPVDDDRGDAKFNKATKQLTVTLAVQPAKSPVVGHTEGNQAENHYTDVMGSADKAGEAELVRDEQNELNISDANCDVQPQENKPVHDEEEEEEKTHFSSVEVENDQIKSLESKSKPLHLAGADATLNCEINKTETSRSPESALNQPVKGFFPGAHICTQKMSLEPHANKETRSSQEQKCPSEIKSIQPDVTAPAVKPEKFSSVGKIASGSQLKVPVVESLNTPLDKDTIKCTSRASPEDQNHSTKLSSTLVPRTVDSSKQSKTDFSITTPVILREKNPEDGREVIITDHSTSAALSLQNSLWFELD